MEATCSESQYDQIENHHKGGEGKTEGEADGEGKDKGNLEYCYYGTLENPCHRIRPLSGRNAHLSANMFLITLNSVFFFGKGGQKCTISCYSGKQRSTNSAVYITIVQKGCKLVKAFWT